jgi:hypothetical protein
MSNSLSDSLHIVSRDWRTRTPGLLAAALCGLCLMPSLGSADTKPANAALSAAQIVDRHVAARGGLQAWRAVQTISYSGKLDAGAGDSTSRTERFVKSARTPTNKKDLAQSPAADDKASDRQVQLPFTLSMQRPRRSRVELVFAGKTAVQVFDGTQGWKIRPYLNRNDVEPFTPTELKSEAGRGEIEGPLVDYAAKGTKIELDKEEPVEGRDAYKLKLTLKDGTVEHVWIDAKSFLDVKVEGAPRKMDGRMHSVWVYQRDFRPVQGVMVPFLLETAVDGYRDTHKMVIEKVAVNPKLTDALFAKPRGV